MDSIIHGCEDRVSEKDRLMTRILHILDHSIPLYSGYAFRTVSILNQQRAMGWETVHLTSTKHPASVDEEDVDGLHFYRTRPTSELLYHLPVLNQIAVINDLEKRLLEICRQDGPDLLHAHSPALNGIATLRVGSRLGIPFLYEMRASWEDAAVDHGTTTEGSLRYRLSRWLETYVLKRADAITAISEGLRKDILSRGIPVESVTLIPNAIDASMLVARTEKDQGLLQDLELAGKTVLGFIGSFYAYEGLSILLDAFPAILAQHPGARILLVGGGPQDENLREQVGRLGLQDKVRFTGRVPHERVRDYYSLVDIAVFPRFSMRLTEMVTPLKPLEAMAQRCMVLASDVGGHRELIRNGVTGVLFPSGDAAALAGAANRLLADRTIWAAMLDAGIEFILRERTWEASAANYRPIVERLVPASC